MPNTVFANMIYTSFLFSIYLIFNGISTYCKILLSLTVL